MIAAMAKEDGCLLLGPMYQDEVVGYICVITDPDGNTITLIGSFREDY